MALPQHQLYGYLIVRQLFTPAEVSDIRRIALDLPLEERHRDLLSLPTLRHVLLDERLLRVFRTLVGPELVYYGDSTVSINALSHGFHKDNPDRNDPNGPDWKSDYPLWRCGIYTQSHKGQPNGLDLRRGSHVLTSLHEGEHVQADTEPGDVVFWNGRTTHSGYGITFRGRPIDPTSLAGKMLWKVRAIRNNPKVRVLRAKSQLDRVVLFASLSAPGPHLERFILSMKSREYGVKMALDQRHDAEALAAAESAGITIRDMKREVTERPHHVVRADHWQLPY
jgi:hypothetical protein